MDWERVVRQAIVPVATAYVGVVWVLLAYRRALARGRVRRAPRSFGPPSDAPSPGTPRRRLLSSLLRTAAAGYAIFLAIVVVFYFVLGARDATFLRQALVEGSVLAFGIAVPGLLILDWLHDRLARR